MTNVAGRISPPVRVRALDVDILNDDSTFNAGLQHVSGYRREKALRYRFRRDRNLSLGAGLLLDALLRQYGLREKQMEYEENKFGKPLFKGFPNIHFNLSHAGKYAVCAIGSTMSGIGIDIEPLRPFDPEIARCCMSDEELSFLYRLSGTEQAEAFTRLWTLKESCLKAVGTGLSEQRFPSFEIRSDRIVPRYKECRFYGFSCPDNYQLSLCVLRQYPESSLVPQMEWLTETDLL